MSIGKMQFLRKHMKALFKYNGNDITTEDLMADIYSAAKKKEALIDNTFSAVSPLIQDISQAVILMPILVQLQGMGIKNDEQLIKLLAIVLKKQSENAITPDGFVLSDEDKKQLLKEVKNAVEQKPGPA